jgi:hypothetical protein
VHWEHYGDDPNAHQEQTLSLRLSRSCRTNAEPGSSVSGLRRARAVDHADMLRASRSLSFWRKRRGHERLAAWTGAAFARAGWRCAIFGQFWIYTPPRMGGDDPPGRYRWRYPREYRPVVASNQPGVIDCDG